MLYTKERFVLKVIRKSEPQLPNFYYDWNDIWAVVQKSHHHITDRQFIAAINALSQKEYITFANGQKTAFLLERKGMYFFQHCIACAFRYILDNWIDFIALAVSIFSLYKSSSL